MNPIRYTTLVKQCGRPVVADGMRLAAYRKAIRENRVITVHNSFESDQHRDWAEVGHHHINVITRLVFPKSLPVPDETLVLAIHHFTGHS
jgi:hypothetical protein